MMNFDRRHIGITPASEKAMLSELNIDSMADLLHAAIPSDIRVKLQDFPSMSEQAFEQHIESIRNQNTVSTCVIGQGFYPTHCPAVIRRNILENPSWYTQYTPYQAEISQGRLEALLNFQTLICELTGLPVANSSLLDEGIACAEALFMAIQTCKRSQKKLLISADLFDASIQVIQSRFRYLNVHIDIQHFDHLQIDDRYSAVIGQFPSKTGALHDYSTVFLQCESLNVTPILSADLMALTLYKSPAQQHAAIAVGSAQRFGVPMGFGGPSAAYISCKESFKRLMPGRIIGASTDRHGSLAYRMALQTREQHIRREKATSNICTAQVLLAIINSFYAIYYGPDGLKHTAKRIHCHATSLAQSLRQAGVFVYDNDFFDTILCRINHASELTQRALDASIEWYQVDNCHIQMSISECTTTEELTHILSLFDAELSVTDDSVLCRQNLIRHDSYLSQSVFHDYRSETMLMRYMKQLERKDLSLTDSMIPLGSCTMKLNAAIELLPLSFREFSSIHPYSNSRFTTGYQTILFEVEQMLSQITGFAKTSLQPNSGAQGEFAGLMSIRSYFDSINESHRNIAFIPTSAHGTNPASASLCGLTIVPIKCTSDGRICMIDLNQQLIRYGDQLAVIMITYPSTFGVFDSEIKQICHRVHTVGAQVYLDGANMNAMIGLTAAKEIGADVCHINCHKTFCIPHGGGGPGLGPICVAQHLANFLPKKHGINTGVSETDYVVSMAPYGSASIALIPYAYIRLMGSKGLTRASELALLNANYMAHRLSPYFNVKYTNSNGCVAHELIIDCKPFKKAGGVTVEDIAKRLIDYGYHAPTMSWPVVDTLMIEPTESEGKKELDDYCDALISIYFEIQHIISGEIAYNESPLFFAPHNQLDIQSDWPFIYSTDIAFFPSVCQNTGMKFWPSVSRVDNAKGDRTLICTCPSVLNNEESAA